MRGGLRWPSSESSLEFRVDTHSRGNRAATDMDRDWTGGQVRRGQGAGSFSRVLNRIINHCKTKLSFSEGGLKPAIHDRKVDRHLTMEGGTTYYDFSPPTRS